MLNIVKASAGAGKTHFLTKEYLILAFKHPFAFRNILAVTFTNKAAEEMKQRIIEEISILANNEKSDFISDLKTAYPNLSESEIRASGKAILGFILHNYSDFSVSTIDSFMQSLIKAFAYEIGIQKAYKLVLDTNEVKEELIDRLFEESRKDKKIQNWFEKFIQFKINQGKTWNVLSDLESFSDELFKESYQRIDFDPNALSNNQIKNILDTEIKDFEDEIIQLSKQAEKLVQSTAFVPLQKTKYVIDYLTKHIVNFNFAEKLTPNKSVKNALKGIENWGKKKLSLEETESVEYYFSQLNPILEKALFLITEKSKKYFSAKSLIANFYNLVIMREIEKLLPKYRENNNALLISDLNKLLYQISAENEAYYIYDKVGTRFTNILIDEFQDTSNFQWENFKPLISNSLAEANKNIIVGDIKQSIYRWRSGDWSLLHNKVKQQFGDFASNLNLEFNYRSKENIVFFNNTIFRALAHFIQQDINDEIDQNANSEDLEKIKNSGYKNVISQVYEDVMQKMPKKGTRKGGKINIQFYEHSDFLDENLALLIENKLLEGYVTAKDIAILVRTNGQSDKIAQMLYQYMNADDQRLKYDIITQNSLSLENSSAVNAIISSLHYIFNPKDKPSLLALINNILELNKKYIDHEVVEAVLDDFIFPYLPEKFTQLVKESSAYSLYELVERIISTLNLNFPDEKAYLLAFLDVVHDYSSLEVSSIESFLDWWKQKSDKFSVQVSEQANAIRIMTIHKSKGLAFNVVIVPFLEQATNYEGNRQPTLWVQNSWSDIGEGIFPVKYSKTLLKTHFSEDYLKERIQVAMDALNNLYVAFTRAKTEIIAFAPKAKNSNKKLSEYIYRIFTEPNILQAQENEIKLSEYWTAENKLFSFELNHKDIQKAGYEDNSIKTFSGIIDTIDWRDKISYRSSVDEFVIQSIQALHDKVSYGKLMHQVMSKIKYADEVESILMNLHAENFISKELLDEISPQIYTFVNLDSVADWYSRNWEVLNEQGIITEKGDLRIPDRLIKNKEKYIVIDYKFAIQREEHKEQVAEYIQILQNMQNLHVEGYLYYPETAQIIRVES